MLLLTRGIPGSGKSTFAKGWVEGSPETRMRLNRDDLRKMLYGVSSGLTFEQEKAVTRIQHEAARDAIKRGIDVIVDDTNLRAKWVRDWMKIAPVDFVDFPVDLNTAIKRDSLRLNSVGEEVIRRFYDRFTRKGVLPEPPAPDADPATGEPYVKPEGAPPAVIVDIDGTLAHIDTTLENPRSPYDYTRVSEDVLDETVAAFVKQKNWEGYTVFFVSGREGTRQCREDTMEWLGQNGVRGFLLMRPEGDGRRDDVVKLEIFNKYIRNQYAVDLVLDDRDRVVRAWRSIGLTVWQVNEGDF